MFLGTHFPRLDEKGRLILPARFREGLAAGLVLTKGQERCLVCWPRAEFDAYAETLRAGDLTSERDRAYRRMLFATAHDDIPDKQGRITIPPALREYASLTRDIAVAGQDTRIEIWDAPAWSAYETAQEQAFAELDGGVSAMR